MECCVEWGLVFNVKEDRSTLFRSTNISSIDSKTWVWMVLLSLKKKPKKKPVIYDFRGGLNLIHVLMDVKMLARNGESGLFFITSRMWTDLSHDWALGYLPQLGASPEAHSTRTPPFGKPQSHIQVKSVCSGRSFFSKRSHQGKNYLTKEFNWRCSLRE